MIWSLLMKNKNVGCEWWGHVYVNVGSEISGLGAFVIGEGGIVI